MEQVLGQSQVEYYCTVACFVSPLCFVNLRSDSSNNHCFSSNSDWSVTIPSLIQIIQLAPLIIFKFSDKIFSIPTANDICCIRTMCCGIFRYLAEKCFAGCLSEVRVHRTGRVVVWRSRGYLILLWTKRVIRSVGPFKSIHIQKFRLERTISIACITSNSECFTFIIPKTICIIMPILCWLNWIVIFAIETEKKGCVLRSDLGTITHAWQSFALESSKHNRIFGVGSRKVLQDG